MAYFHNLTKTPQTRSPSRKSVPGHHDAEKKMSDRLATLESTFSVRLPTLLRESSETDQFGSWLGAYEKI